MMFVIFLPSGWIRSPTADKDAATFPRTLQRHGGFPVESLSVICKMQQRQTQYYECAVLWMWKPICSEWLQCAAMQNTLTCPLTDNLLCRSVKGGCRPLRWAHLMGAVEDLCGRTFKESEHPVGKTPNLDTAGLSQTRTMGPLFKRKAQKNIYVCAAHLWSSKTPHLLYTAPTHG